MTSKWMMSLTGNGAKVWELAKDATVRLPHWRKGLVARVERGTLVVTQAGDPEDHVLAAGDEVRLPPGGLAVAWALTPSLLTVCDGARAEASLPCQAAA
jgi:hypothetical protein